MAAATSGPPGGPEHSGLAHGHDQPSRWVVHCTSTTITSTTTMPIDQDTSSRVRRSALIRRHLAT